MDTEFQTVVFVSDLDDHSHSYKNVKLKWKYDLELRDYGVKSFSISVPDQVVNATMMYEEDDIDMEKEVTLQIKDCKVELFTADLQSSSFAIHAGELELYKGKWTAKFDIV